MATAPRANYKKAGISKKELHTVSAKFESIAKGLTVAAREGSKEFAEDVLRTAVKNAPKETGALRASGKIRMGRASNSVDRSGNKVTVEVVFGGTLNAKAENFQEWDGRTKNLKGGLVTYAAVIHETHEGGGRFFLRNALQQHANEYKDKVRKRTKNLLRKGGKSNPTSFSGTGF